MNPETTPEKIRMGICAWGDSDISKFYPSNVKTSEQKLQFYSSHYSCTEVDMSHYAIPSIKVTTKWAKVKEIS